MSVVDPDLVDGRDHVAGLDAGRVCRAPPYDAADQAADRDATQGRVGGGDLDRLNAEVGHHQGPVPDDLLDLVPDVGAADREGHRLAVRVRGHGDADHLAGNVQERPAGAAGVNLGVGLDGVGDGQRARRRHRVGHGHRVVERADDPVAGGPRPERAADRDHRLTHPEAGRVAEGKGGQAGDPIDLQHGDVRLAVGVDETGVMAATVAGEKDGQAAGVRHHVRVGDDVAVACGDEAGPQAGPGRNVVGDDRGHGRGRPGRDLEDRRILRQVHVGPEVDRLWVGPGLGAEDGQGHAGGNGSAHDRHDHDQRHHGACPAVTGRRLRR